MEKIVFRLRFFIKIKKKQKTKTCSKYVNFDKFYLLYSSRILVIYIFIKILSLIII